MSSISNLYQTGGTASVTPAATSAPGTPPTSTGSNQDSGYGAAVVLNLSPQALAMLNGSNGITSMSTQPSSNTTGIMPHHHHHHGGVSSSQAASSPSGDPDSSSASNPLEALLQTGGTTSDSTGTSSTTVFTPSLGSV